MGNMDALRDWGHAKDYVRMQWMMLQQAQPKDYVIATGVQCSVREFVRKAADNLGLDLAFQNRGVEEYAVVRQVVGDLAPAVKVGDIVVKVDARYFRPTEVESLLGDAARAQTDLDWEPEITLDELVREMVLSDQNQAKQQALLKNHGFTVALSQES